MLGNHLAAAAVSNRWKRRLTLSSALLIAACALIPLASAEEPSSQELVDLVRKQASEIEALKARLTTLEAAAQGSGPSVADTTTFANSQTGSPDTKIEWEGGLPTFMNTTDGTYFRLRARSLVDASTTFDSEYDRRNVSTSGARAIRVGAQGGMGEGFFYQLEAEFADTELEVKGAFVGWKDEIAGHDYDVRVGNMLKDCGMEGATGNDDTPFLERNVVASALQPRSGYLGVGLMGRLYGENWHSSLQLVGDDIDAEHEHSDHFAVIGRTHVNPIKSGGTVLHLGAWGYTENFDDGSGYLHSTDIGGRFNDNLSVGLGPLPALRGTEAFGLELGGVRGRFWTFAEMGRRELQARELLGGSNIDTHAYSVSAGFFVTGEQSSYSSRLGNFVRPKVLSPVPQGGRGALELLARYESVDFSDAPLGGKGRATTLGVNWYLTDWSRLMLNWIYWHTDNASGDFLLSDSGNTITSRFQVSF